MKVEFYDISKVRDALDIVRVGYTQLCSYREDGRIPSPELLEDIAAYEAILNHSDPLARAKEYFRARDEMGLVRPRVIAKERGWI